MEMATMQVQYIKWRTPARGQAPGIGDHSFHRGRIQRSASQAKCKNLADSELCAYFAGLRHAGATLYSTDFTPLESRNSEGQVRRERVLQNARRAVLHAAHHSAKERLAGKDWPSFDA
jgi:hypothetical protein